jgi:hypothetical protein
METYFGEKNGNDVGKLSTKLSERYVRDRKESRTIYGDEYTAKGFTTVYKKINKACKPNVTTRAIQNLLCAQITISRLVLDRGIGDTTL